MRPTIASQVLAEWCGVALHEGHALRPSAASDPSALAAVLCANGLGPALSHALRAMESHDSPEPVADALRADARVAAAGALAALATLREIAEALDGAGIPWLLWKGPALALAAWGDPARRHFSDLDIVVSPPDRERARDALGNAGWASKGALSRAQERAIHSVTSAYPLTKPGAPLLELHSAFIGRLYPTALEVREVMARADRLSLAGLSVRVPSSTDSLLLLALHATKHGWSQAEEVLTFTRLARRSPAALAAAIVQAEQAGVAPAMDLALHLSEELTGEPLTPETARAADPRVRAMVAECIARMCAGEGNWRETHRWSLSWVTGPRHRVRYLLGALLAPTPQEARFMLLPDPLVGAYPAVRLLRLALRSVGLAR